MADTVAKVENRNDAENPAKADVWTFLLLQCSLGPIHWSGRVKVGVVDHLQQQRSFYSGILKSQFEKIWLIESAGGTLQGTVNASSSWVAQRAGRVTGAMPTAVASPACCKFSNI
jgi:hypothetical protein